MPSHQIWLLGRMNASIQVLTAGAMVLGSLLAGVLAEAMGLRLTLFIASSIAVLDTHWLLLSPVRGAKGSSGAVGETATPV